jgi:hypothetical protein
MLITGHVDDRSIFPLSLKWRAGRVSRAPDAPKLDEHLDDPKEVRPNDGRRQPRRPSAYEIDDEQPDDRAPMLFLHGQRHALAVALHEQTGYRSSASKTGKET